MVVLINNERYLFFNSYYISINSFYKVKLKSFEDYISVYSELNEYKFDPNKTIIKLDWRNKIVTRDYTTIIRLDVYVKII